MTTASQKWLLFTLTIDEGLEFAMLMRKKNWILVNKILNTKPTWTIYIILEQTNDNSDQNRLKIIPFDIQHTYMIIKICISGKQAQLLS